MIKVKEGIYNVGAVDWNLREFHGYVTEEGSTYNAYLIIDEQITLIDTVKEYLYDDMLEAISSVIDPSKIDNIVSLHTEMDHSGGVPMIAEIAKNAKIYASTQGATALKAHFHDLRDVIPVKEDFVLNTGKYNFVFHMAQLLHWPDNMVCYLKEERILFSNDIFGQHLASSSYFDDLYDDGVFFRQLKKYYANIVQCYSEKVLEFAERAVMPYDIDIICPAHGLMIRKYIKESIELYASWASSKVKNKAVVVYDTMWHSTEMLAKEIQKTLEQEGIEAILSDLKFNHMSNVITDVLDSAAVVVGTPTLNSSMLPTVSAFLCYMKGLMHRKSDKVVMGFGSYGWCGGGFKDLENELKNLKGATFLEGYRQKFVPTEENIKEVHQKALEIAEAVKERLAKQ